MLEYITLPNGKNISWDEFSKFSQARQSSLLGTYRGDLHKSSKKVMTPLGEFGNANNAAKAHGVSLGTLSRWIKDGKSGFKYLTPTRNRKYNPNTGARGADNKNSKTISTPSGVFISIKEAAKHYNVTSETIRYWVKKKPDLFKFLNDYNNIATHKNLKNRSKQIMTPAGQFESAKMAALHFNVSVFTIRDRLKVDPRFFYIEHKTQIDISEIQIDPNYRLEKNYVSRHVKTPLGVFTSIKDAAKAHGLRGVAVSSRCKKGRDGFSFVDSSSSV